MPRPVDIWLAAGVRTPFAKVDGALAAFDAIELSVPVARHMVDQLKGGKPDFAVWGVVVPSLTFSNIAREVLMDAGIDATVPAFSTIMACSTSMMGAIEAAGMIDGESYNLALVGGVDSLSRIQIGLGQRLSDWLRKFQQARSLGQKIDQVTHVQLKDIRLFIPAIVNRTTGMSMGEHTEITAKDWQIGRAEQDELALQGQQRAIAAWDRGFFDDLVIQVGDTSRDTIPRKDTSLEKLAALPPAFDRTSGKGTLTAGNSTPLTDGAAGVLLAGESWARTRGLPIQAYLADARTAAVDFLAGEGLLMAPTVAVANLLQSAGLTLQNFDFYEIHEAFAAQVLCTLKAWESGEYC